MGTMSRLVVSLAALAAIALATGCSSPRGTAEAIREAHGGSEFSKIEQIDFTMNIEAGRTELARHWTWKPAEDEVEMFRVQGSDTTDVVYHRAAIGDSALLQGVDALFVTDSRWLLFPYLMTEPEGAVFTVDGPKKPPVGDGTAMRLTVELPKGDAKDKYVLYYDDNYGIKAWTSHPAGGGRSRASWDDMTEVGPLKLYLSHESPQEHFKLWFTDVSVKLHTTGAAAAH
jgi:hypothetical protein